MKSDLLTARLVLQKLGLLARASLWKTIESQKAQLKKEGRAWNPESYVESHAQMKDGAPYGLFGGQDKLPRPRAMLRIVEAALERVHEHELEGGDDAGDELSGDEAHLVITPKQRAREVAATVALLAKTAEAKDLARQVIVEAMDDFNWWGNGSGESGSRNGCPGRPGETLGVLNSIDPLKADLTGCSFFAFHGSALGNWHSLFRVGCTNVTLIPGVNTTNAFGPGIYFAADSSTSMGYARNGGDTSNFWPGAFVLARYCLSLLLLPSQSLHTLSLFIFISLVSLRTRTLTHTISLSLSLTHLSAPPPSHPAVPAPPGSSYDTEGAHEGGVKDHTTMVVCEILYKPEEFSDASQHIVVPDARMVKERFLLVFDQTHGDSSQSYNVSQIHAQAHKTLRERISRVDKAVARV